MHVKKIIHVREWSHHDAISSMTKSSPPMGAAKAAATPAADPAAMKSRWSWRGGEGLAAGKHGDRLEGIGQMPCKLQINKTKWKTCC